MYTRGYKEPDCRDWQVRIEFNRFDCPFRKFVDGATSDEDTIKCSHPQCRARSDRLDSPKPADSCHGANCPILLEYSCELETVATHIENEARHAKGWSR